MSGKTSESFKKLRDIFQRKSVVNNENDEMFEEAFDKAIEDYDGALRRLAEVERKERLDELLAQCTPKNAHEEVEWGSPYPTTTTDKIREWSIARNLHIAEPHKQALKLGEEFGELFEGLAKGNEELTKDAIGDMYVVMTIMAQQLGFTIEECIEIAYDEIKDRKGRMVDGVFVKESDLK